jgi:hypothetical protein
MGPQDTFVVRLRSHRERSRISLNEISAATQIKSELLEAFERNDLSGWPRGVYARAWIAAYASVVGLDPRHTVEEFCRLFPQGDRRLGGMLQEIAAIVAHPSEYRDEFAHDIDRRRSPAFNVLQKPAWHLKAARTLQALSVRLLALKPQTQRLKRTLGLS